MQLTKETFLSSDGKTQVAAFFYRPQGEVKAVVQLSHGMCEYVCRYAHMAKVMCQAGFAFCGNDHLGHGYTGDPADYGFKAEKDGWQYVLKDLETMNGMIHAAFPGKPLILLGHSMGSFYARFLAEKCPQAMDGLIISGTGGPGLLFSAGKLLASTLCRLKGPRYVSQLMVDASMGSYCKGIESEGSGNAWLSRDPQVWEKYAADPMCSFKFTVSAYRDMLTAYCHVNSAQWAPRLRKDMPILIYSGDKDPVGSFGKGVIAVNDMLLKAGCQDVTLRLYPGARHEMHNESNKEEVFDLITGWINDRYLAVNAPSAAAAP